MVKLHHVHDYAVAINSGKIIGAANPEIKKIYDSLISAINKFALEEDITFFSGKTTSNFKLNKYLKFGPQVHGEERGLIGKQINTDSFINGSFNRTTGDMFAITKTAGTDVESALKTLKDTGAPVLYEVRVPAGQKLTLPNAAHLRDSLGNSLFEQEVVLPPNTPLYILDARWITVPRKSFGKQILTRTLHVKAEVRAMPEKIMSREAELSAANYNFKMNLSNISAETVVPPKTAKLNRREEILKVEENPGAKQLKTVTENVKIITEDLKALNNDSVNNSVKRINEEFNDTNKFNQLVKKAMDAVKNCVRGKV